MAIATFWRTFHHDGKISPAWWGCGLVRAGAAQPLSLYLLSRTKLWFTLQLIGQVHSPVSTLVTLPLYRMYSVGALYLRHKGLLFSQRRNKIEIWNGSTYKHDLSDICRSHTHAECYTCLENYISNFPPLWIKVYTLSTYLPVSYRIFFQWAKRKRNIFRWLCKICHTNLFLQYSRGLKGQCHEMNNFFEGLKHQTRTFCIWANGF